MSLKTVLAKIGKVIAWPFEHASQVIETLSTALKDEPEVKTAVVGLVSQIETLTKDGAVAVAAHGIDIPDDLAEVAAAQALWAYVKGTFLPAIEAAYKDVEAAVKVPSPAEAVAAAVGAAPALSTVQTGPGLAAVTTD
jgi:hypothetical protein